MRLIRTLRCLLAGLALLLLGTSGVVAQGTNASVWGVNAASQIWQWQGNGQWKQVPGELSNVSIGSDGTVWGVNKASQIFSWNGTQWTQMPGALTQVSVGTARDIWGVNANDDIWRWDGTK